jgi:DNA primase
VLDDIRFRSDIADVIGSYIPLQRAGASFKALCPFHKEKTPSFHVNPQRQIFHCFGCGAGGDVFRFVMQHESVDFMDAVRMLAERAGVRLEMDEDREGGSDKALLYRIHSELAERYHKALLESPLAEAARAYLKRRSLPPDVVKEFLIGYAPDRWDLIVKWAQKSHTPLEQVEKAGLILRSTRPDASSPYYDRFRDRLMFPIWDEQGRVVGFSGRIMTDRPDTAKYVNSPETPLFQKSRILYALNKARRLIAEAREALVCEGQIDVIRCHQAGFKTAVASQGTAFTEDHVRIVKRYADSVVIVFDSDHAGQEASIKTATLFMEAGLTVRVATLPEGEDPDSLILKEGADGFRRVLDGASSAIDFQLSVLRSREDASTEAGLRRITQEMLKTLARVSDAVLREKMLQAAAHRLRVRPEHLQEDLRRVRLGQPARALAASASAPAERPKEEVELCEHIVHADEHPSLADLVEAHLPSDMLRDAACRAVVAASVESVRAGKPFQACLEAYGDAARDLQQFSAQVLMAPPKVKGKGPTREDAVRSLILRIWQRELESERAEMDSADAQALTREQEETRRQLTYDLKMLRRWEDGEPIIAVRLEERKRR